MSVLRSRDNRSLARVGETYGERRRRMANPPNPNVTSQKQKSFYGTAAKVQHAANARYEKREKPNSLNYVEQGEKTPGPHLFSQQEIVGFLTKLIAKL